jgi:hypothetical protein
MSSINELIRKLTSPKALRELDAIYSAANHSSAKRVLQFGKVPHNPPIDSFHFENSSVEEFFHDKIERQPNKLGDLVGKRRKISKQKKRRTKPITSFDSLEVL